MKPEDPRLVALLAETDISFEDLKQTAPLPVHGDGVEYLEDDSLAAQSFGPLLASGDSFDCLFLMGAYPYSCAVKSTRKVGPKEIYPLGVKSASCSLEVLKHYRKVFILLLAQMVNL